MRGFFLKYFSDNRESVDHAAFKLIALAVAFICIPIGVSAAAIITEILYDAPGTDTGREWIEVQNTGSTSIDLSNWKVFEANTNHKISPVGSPTVPAGGFAIIADSPDKFRIDNPSFTGLLFDSAFSLSNEGETLTLRDETGVDGDSVSYLPAWGAAGDGNSLQKSSAGMWISAPFTLGLPTVATESSVSPTEATAGSARAETPATETSTAQVSAVLTSPEGFSVHSAQDVANTSDLKPDFEITAGRPRLGFVGSPLSFEAKVKSSKSVPSGTVIRSMWSMGDGKQVFGDVISHAYQFAGDYIVVANSDSNGEHAVAKTLVRIVEPNLRLALLPGDVIEIANLDRGEINLGGFAVGDSVRRFVLPQDTIIRAQSFLKLSPQLTRLAAPRDALKIVDPSGKVIFSTPIRVQEAEIVFPAGFSLEKFKELIIKSSKNHANN